MTGPGPESAPPPEQPASPPPASPPPASPPPAGPPPSGAPSGMPAWTSQLTSTAPVAGPAGLYYADVPNRIIAIIIDAIIVGLVGFVIGLFLPPVSQFNPNATGFGDLVTINPVGALLRAAVNLIVSGGYFVYMWTQMRGTVGMMVLGLQLGNETDGKSITINQAAIRWALLFGLGALGTALTGAPAIGALIGLANIIWVIVLLVTTAQSPTKQGLHDRYAHTIMVKAARAVG